MAGSWGWGSQSKRGLNKVQADVWDVNNLSKHFIFSNNNTICHRNITEEFKTGLAQVFFYVRSLWKNKCSISQTKIQKELRHILQIILILKTRHTHTQIKRQSKLPKSSTSSKITSLKEWQLLLFLIIKPLMPHKIMNSTQPFKRS